jgi:hypothetical protein
MPGPGASGFAARAAPGARQAASWWVIVRSGLFDQHWYAQQRGRRAGTGRVAAAVAAAHYVRRGRRAGLSPHPLLEPSWYAPNDWQTRAVDPFATLLRHPAGGPAPHPLFDPALWVQRHPEALAARGGPLGHFCRLAGPDTLLPVPADLMVPFPGGAPARPPAELGWGTARARLTALVANRRDGVALPAGSGTAGQSGGIAVLVVSGDGWPQAWVSATSALRAAGPGDRVQVSVLDDAGSRADAVLLGCLPMLDDRIAVCRSPQRLGEPAGLSAAAGPIGSGTPVLALRRGLQLWPGWAAAIRAALADPGVAVAQAVVLASNGRVASAGLLDGPDGAPCTGRGLALDDLRRQGPVLPLRGAEPGAVAFRRADLLAATGAGERVLALDAVAAPAERLRRGVRLPAARHLLPTPQPAGRATFRPPGPPTDLPAARWVIRTAMPVDPRSLGWGDLYFARCLAAALERLGRQVVVDFRPAVELGVQPPCDVELILRGLEPATPRAAGQPPVRLMWVISHPDQVSDAELAAMDLVFAASLPWSAQAGRRTGTPVRPLLQATDPQRFHPGAATTDLGAPVAEHVLFAGNSRGVFRPVVRHLVEAGLDVGVYGAQWARFLGNGRVRAEFLPNERLAAAYATAGVVLNDHWDDMRQQGFISNRVFDAAACGARVVSDRIDGMEQLFGGLVRGYSDGAELVQLVRDVPAGFPDDEQRRRIGEQVGLEHSFDRRAAELLQAALDLLAARAPSPD